jgi:hypothetical protein
VPLDTFGTCGEKGMGNMRRIRRSFPRSVGALCAGAIFLSIGVGASPAAAPTVTVTIIDLGIPPGMTQSEAVMVTDSGQILGRSENTSGGEDLFIATESGPLVPLGLSPPIVRAQGLPPLPVLSEDGDQVIGETRDSFSKGASWISPGPVVSFGPVSQLSPGFWRRTTAQAVNQAGVVVGTSDTGEDIPGSPCCPAGAVTRAYAWTSPGPMVPLASLGG